MEQRACGDKIDYGAHLIPASDEDKEALKTIVTKLGVQMPDTKMAIYKNRRGQYNNMLVWIVSNKATCRFNGVFATDYNYKIIDMPDLKITVEEEIK